MTELYMHIIQQKILQLASQIDIAKLGLRKLGAQIGETHPQKIKHHLEQLLKIGLLVENKKTNTIKPAQQQTLKTASFFNLPILGSANCGPADLFADENIEGYLKVSPAVIGRKNCDGLFIIKAVGDSMNQTKDLKSGPINNGDYVVVNKEKRNPQNGDYVLSIIEDTANLKRFYLDKVNKQIALVSESTLNIPPIYIHENDFEKYMVNGTVEKVIKQVRV